MKVVNNNNFGLLIAYVLPGFVALSGIQYFSPTLRTWLGATAPDAPTVSGFLFITIASVAMGLFVSTLRWLLIDTLHHKTGLRKPAFNYKRFEARVGAMQYLVENQYRYYQAYANAFIAVAIAFVAFSWNEQRILVGHLILIITVELVLWLGSRDTLKNYYLRVSMMLGTSKTQNRATKKMLTAVAKTED